MYSLISMNETYIYYVWRVQFGVSKTGREATFVNRGKQFTYIVYVCTSLTTLPTRSFLCVSMHSRTHIYTYYLFIIGFSCMDSRYVIFTTVHVCTYIKKLKVFISHVYIYHHNNS